MSPLLLTTLFLIGISLSGVIGLWAGKRIGRHETEQEIFTAYRNQPVVLNAWLCGGAKGQIENEIAAHRHCQEAWE